MLDLIASLKSVSTEVCACKICGGKAPLYGVVDFHRPCDIAHGARFSLSGVRRWSSRLTSINNDSIGGTSAHATAIYPLLHAGFGDGVESVWI